jgi:hypothetical protein
MSDSIIERLRRANPVPEAETAPATELFARITALPGDSRLAASARPRRRHRRTIVLAFAALLVVVLTTAFTFTLSHWIGADVVRPPVTKQEYIAAQKQLTLPPGYSWPTFRFPPDAANSVTMRGAGGGHAVMAAQWSWECYWVHAIRTHDAAGSARAHAALDALLAHNTYEAPAGAPEDWTPSPLPTRPFMVYAHDGGLDWIRAGYRLAAAGDPTRIAQSCRANVPG